MEVKSFIDKLKQTQNLLVQYIENENNLEENYQNVIERINDLNIVENQNDFQLLLRMISKIAKKSLSTP